MLKLADNWILQTITKIVTDNLITVGIPDTSCRRPLIFLRIHSNIRISLKKQSVVAHPTMAHPTVAHPTVSGQ